MSNNSANFGAFPVSLADSDVWQQGLTKREYFAGLAMQGILAGGKLGYIPGLIAEKAVDCADALLQELEQEVTE